MRRFAGWTSVVSLSIGQKPPLLTDPKSEIGTARVAALPGQYFTFAKYVPLRGIDLTEKSVSRKMNQRSFHLNTDA